MTVTPAEASDAGQFIEHTETLFEGTFGGALSPLDLPDSIRGFRSPGGGAAALFSRFPRNGMPVTPVLGAWRYLIEHPDTLALAEPHIRYVARSLRESARESPLISSEQVPARRSPWRAQTGSRQPSRSFIPGYDSPLSAAY